MKERLKVYLIGDSAPLGWKGRLAGAGFPTTVEQALSADFERPHKKWSFVGPGAVREPLVRRREKEALALLEKELVLTEEQREKLTLLNRERLAGANLAFAYFERAPSGEALEEIDRAHAGGICVAICYGPDLSDNTFDMVRAKADLIFPRWPFSRAFVEAKKLARFRVGFRKFEKRGAPLPVVIGEYEPQPIRPPTEPLKILPGGKPFTELGARLRGPSGEDDGPIAS
jgi:hypothetical protein